MKIKVRTSLTSTIEVLREEVELSNMRTAYVMHIPNTLSLTSARSNRKQKFQSLFSSVNFILIMLLRCFLFTAALLLCAVRDAPVQNSRITFNRMLFFSFGP